MKALSLWQPWASAIALGAKTIETRHWKTPYRGPIAIHAAQRRNRRELADIEQMPEFAAAFWDPCDKFRPFAEELPFGALVATANLVDIRPSDKFSIEELCTARMRVGAPEHLTWCECQMGNFNLGRFGWVLADIAPLIEPIPFKGGQGLFNVPDEVFQ